MELKQYRAEIDSIDDMLIKLFERRMRVSGDIAAYKSARGLPILDPERERDKLNKLCARVPPEYEPYARRLYNMLFELSRDRQSEIISGERA